MAPKKTSANNSLLLRGSTWHIHWNVPKHLRHLPLFRGKKIYSATLKTGDVYEVRKMRDLIVTQFREIAEASATQLSRRAFMDAYAEAKRAKEELNAKLVYLNDEELPLEENTTQQVGQQENERVQQEIGQGRKAPGGGLRVSSCSLEVVRQFF